MENQVTNERRGFILYYMWAMLVLNFAMAVCIPIIGGVTASDPELAEKVGQSLIIVFIALIGELFFPFTFFLGSPCVYVTICLSAVNVAGTILLFKWHKLGYWIICLSSVISIIMSFIYLDVTLMNVSMVGDIVGPILLYFLLIKKNKQNFGNKLW